MSTHDIERDGTRYIMEWQPAEDGNDPCQFTYGTDSKICIIHDERIHPSDDTCPGYVAPRPGYVGITEACDPTPCDWFINTATTPSWCCNTHMYDGTGDYPANAGLVLPETCPFSPLDEDGECYAEHETYDFYEEVK